MNTENKTALVVEVTINAPKEKVWKYWTEPQHIKNWCFATDDWHAPEAENDLRTGGKFRTVMAAKDGSFAFDFEGTYSEVKELEKVVYQMSDGRNVDITFKDHGNATQVIEAFDPESENPLDMQQAGWQSILNNFKKYVEAN